MLQAQQLPLTWQPGMMLSITTSGGMRPHTHTIVISDADSFESNSGEGDNDHVSFSVTQAELDSLLAFLHKKHFTKITAVRRKHIMHDMGTTTMELHWDGRVTAISTGASMEAAAPYLKDKSAIDNYIWQLVAAKKK